MMVGVDDVEDFLNQMRIAVMECCSPLYEIPMGSYWLGSPVVHGPWPATRCAAVLKIWYKAELIRLHFQSLPPEWDVTPGEWATRLVDGDILADPDAEELLDHPERWVRTHADGYVEPCMTWQGEVATSEEWFADVVEAAGESAAEPPSTFPV